MVAVGLTWTLTTILLIFLPELDVIAVHIISFVTGFFMSRLSWDIAKPCYFIIREDE